MYTHCCTGYLLIDQNWMIPNPTLRGRTFYTASLSRLIESFQIRYHVSPRLWCDEGADTVRLGRRLAAIMKWPLLLPPHIECKQISGLRNVGPLEPEASVRVLEVVIIGIATAGPVVLVGIGNSCKTAAKCFAFIERD